MTDGRAEGPRDRVKHLAERALVASGIHRWWRARRRDAALILAYHNIVPRHEPAVGDLSLHLPQERFAAQLDALRDTHDVVPLDSLFEQGGRGRPRAALTFDDAYRGAVTAGVAELTRRSLPATIFVAPAFVGGESFWWDALEPPGAGGPDAAWSATALAAGGGEDARVREWAAARGYRTRALPAHATAATEEELRNAVSHPGITLGSHSWSHPNLAALAPAALTLELRRSREWLRQRFATVTDVLAYPYGLSSAAVERAAADAGYRAALRIRGGWVRGSIAGRYAVPRLNVPAGLSLEGFVLRAAGLLSDR